LPLKISPGALAVAFGLQGEEQPHRLAIRHRLEPAQFRGPQGCGQRKEQDIGGGGSSGPAPVGWAAAERLTHLEAQEMAPAHGGSQASKTIRLNRGKTLNPNQRQQEFRAKAIALQLGKLRAAGLFSGAMAFKGSESGN
jgi:hypothetical protein